MTMSLTTHSSVRPVLGSTCHGLSMLTWNQVLSVRTIALKSRLCSERLFYSCKNDNLYAKTSFLNSAHIHNCGYALEPPNPHHPRQIGFVLWDHCQNLLDDPRTSVRAEIRNICSHIVYPCKPQFYHIKWNQRGSKYISMLKIIFEDFIYVYSPLIQSLTDCVKSLRPNYAGPIAHFRIFLNFLIVGFTKM